MNHTYQNPTIEFLYPEGWSVDESRTADGLTVSLQSPYSMFVFLNYYDDAMESQELADQALETMEQEYAELDADPISESIGGLPAVGYDVNFFSLDLTNSCWIRAISASDRTILIFAQTNDLDLEQGESAFRSICASLKIRTADPA